MRLQSLNTGGVLPLDTAQGPRAERHRGCTTDRPHRRDTSGPCRRRPGRPRGARRPRQRPSTPTRPSTTAFWQTVRGQAKVAGELAHGAMGENLCVRTGWKARSDGRPCASRLRTDRGRRIPASVRPPMGFAQAVSLMAQSGYCGLPWRFTAKAALAAGDSVEADSRPAQLHRRALSRRDARKPGADAAALAMLGRRSGRRRPLAKVTQVLGRPARPTAPWPVRRGRDGRLSHRGRGGRPTWRTWRPGRSTS